MDEGKGREKMKTDAEIREYLDIINELSAWITKRGRLEELIAIAPLLEARKAAVLWILGEEDPDILAKLGATDLDLLRQPLKAKKEQEANSAKVSKAGLN